MVRANSGPLAGGIRFADGDVSEGVSNATPLPVDSDDLLDALNQIIDALERIQQQLGRINNGNNLEPGERFE